MFFLSSSGGGSGINVNVNDNNNKKQGKLFHAYLNYFDVPYTVDMYEIRERTAQIKAAADKEMHAHQSSSSSSSKLSLLKAKSCVGLVSFLYSCVISANLKHSLKVVRMVSFAHAFY